MYGSKVDVWIGNVDLLVRVTCEILMAGTEKSRYLCMHGEKTDGSRAHGVVRAAVCGSCRRARFRRGRAQLPMRDGKERGGRRYVWSWGKFSVRGCESVVIMGACSK